MTRGLANPNQLAPERPVTRTKLPRAYAGRGLFRVSRRTTIGALPLLLAWAAGPLAAQTPPSLRYSIQTGDWLVYERRAVIASLETGAVEQQVTDQIQVWCFDERPNDGLLVLLDLIHIVDGRIEPALGAVLSLNARGARRIDPIMQSRVADMDAAFDVIPVLPDAGRGADRWETPADGFGRVWTCTANGPDPNRAGESRIGFVVGDTTHVGEFIGEERFGTFWFDQDAGIVSRVESELRHQAAGVTVQAKIKLVRREKRDPAWVLARADEARKFVALLRNEDDLLAKVLRKPAEIEQTVSQLERTWAAFAQDTSDRARSPFRAVAAGFQHRVAGGRKSLHEAAQRCERWLGRNAPDWTLQTADSRSMRSSDLRGGVTVECYWSAESLWGLRSLELMRLLQRDLGAAARDAERAAPGERANAAADRKSQSRTDEKDSGKDSGRGSDKDSASDVGKDSAKDIGKQSGKPKAVPTGDDARNIAAAGREGPKVVPKGSNTMAFTAPTGAELRAVRIVCMNMDGKADLARRAIQTCGDGLTHVLAEPLGDNEPPLDFPTVRVIDRNGVIRDVFLGWQPDLPQRVAAAVSAAIRN